MIIPSGIFYGLLSAMAWGVGDFFAALFSRKIGIFKALFWNVVSGFVLMIGYFYIAHSVIVISFSALLIVIFIGLIQILGTLCFYKGFEVGRVSLVSPLAAICSFWTVMISIFLFKERLGVIQLIGVAAVILGTFLVSTKLKTLLSEARFIASDPGIKFALLASIFWGVSFAFLSPLAKEYGWLQASVLLRISMAVWIVILMLVLKKNLCFSPGRITLSFLAVVALTDVIGYFLMGVAFKNDLASVVAPVASIFPVITILLARVFLKEKLAVNQLLGIGGILAGLVLLSV